MSIITTTTPTPPVAQQKKRGTPAGVSIVSDRTRLPGSWLAARALGVDHSHLYRVLLGKRVSASLMQRYEEWCAANPEILCAVKTASGGDLTAQSDKKRKRRPLALRGWGYREAADKIGVNLKTLQAHLNGTSHSPRIAAALAALPWKVT